MKTCRTVYECRRDRSDPCPRRAQAPATAKGPTVTRIESRASLDGKPIDLFRLTNGHGMELEAMTYGGIITSLKVPDRAGNVADVVLGFDTPRAICDRHPRSSAR